MSSLVEDFWTARRSWQIDRSPSITVDGLVVERLRFDDDDLAALLGSRADAQPELDPKAALACMRAGLGAIMVRGVALVHATPEEAAVVWRGRVGPGLHGPSPSGRTAAKVAARGSLLFGVELGVWASTYVVPTVAELRALLEELQTASEEALPQRCCARIGARMNGRGEHFHPAMAETLSEQLEMLRAHMVDLDQLASWWWHGATVVAGPAGPRLVDALPNLAALEELVD